MKKVNIKSAIAIIKAVSFYQQNSLRKMVVYVTYMDVVA